MWESFGFGQRYSVFGRPLAAQHSSVRHHRGGGVQLVMRSCQWMLLKVEAGAWLDQKTFFWGIPTSKNNGHYSWMRWPPCDQKGPAWLWKSKKDEWWWSGHLISPFFLEGSSTSFYSSSSIVVVLFLKLMSLSQLNPFFTCSRPIYYLYKVYIPFIAQK